MSVATEPADLDGLALARRFFHEAVAPVVDRAAPGLRFSAGLIGSCSEVLGLDDQISRDHWWGPRCWLLVDPAAPFDDVRGRLDNALRNQLPVSFLGYSTNYDGMARVSIDRPPVNHAVEIITPDRFLAANLGITAATSPRALDWLRMDEQKLLEVTSGELFRDDLAFQDVRDRLAHYPDDLRLHLMAVEWHRILDEQAFPGRAGARGDEAGAALVAARLAESVMRLGFYLDRRYAPYGKWFGSAFARLPCAATLNEPLTRMLTSPGWAERDRHWTVVLERLIAAHEQAGLLAPAKYRPAPVYLGRPGIGLPQFERPGGPPSLPALIDELRSRISDPEVLALPRRLGSINQLAACRDLEDGRPLGEGLAAVLGPGPATSS
jgi:hypothetical protein